MIPSFYEYAIRFHNSEANDPKSRLANTIKADPTFPKQSQSFNEITDYMESHSEYSRLLAVFDDLFATYQFDYF